MTTIIGDVHGDIDTLFSLGKGLDRWIQIGDLGWGMTSQYIPKFPDNGRAIRGNHDDPEVARSHPSYLGDYGVTEEGIFYVSGAKTPDFDIKRRMMKAAEENSHPLWWEDEQLSYPELQKACALYEQTKPEIVITHDAPFCLYPALIAAVTVLNPEHRGEPEPNVTSQAFNNMFHNIHRPRYWYFGHWHTTWAINFHGTWFRCVNINEIVTAGTLNA